MGWPDKYDPGVLRLVADLAGCTATREDVRDYLSKRIGQATAVCGNGKCKRKIRTAPRIAPVLEIFGELLERAREVAQTRARRSVETAIARHLRETVDRQRAASYGPDRVQADGAEAILRTLQHEVRSGQVFERRTQERETVDWEARDAEADAAATE